jgi:RNA polymerase sigma factor (sigma-70 family)
MTSPINWAPKDQALLEQARQGNRAAAMALFDAYPHHFLFIIRKRLMQPLRRLIDSFDVLQDVRLELCKHDLPPSALESQETFFKYLTGMVLHQMRGYCRWHLAAQKRDLHRDLPLEKSGAAEMPAPATQVCEPSAFEDQWAKFLHNLPPVYRAILLLSRQGQTQKSIAFRLGISERTVRRVIYWLTPSRGSVGKNVIESR